MRGLLVLSLLGLSWWWLNFTVCCEAADDLIKFNEIYNRVVECIDFHSEFSPSTKFSWLPDITPQPCKWLESTFRPHSNFSCVYTQKETKKHAWNAEIFALWFSLNVWSKYLHDCTKCSAEFNVVIRDRVKVLWTLYVRHKWNFKNNSTSVSHEIHWNFYAFCALDGGGKASACASASSKNSAKNSNNSKSFSSLFYPLHICISEFETEERNSIPSNRKTRFIFLTCHGESAPRTTRLEWN